MVTTLAIIIGLSTLFFTAVLSFLEIFDIFPLVSFVLLFNIMQWLLAPYLVDALYQVREVSPSENPVLHGMVERLSHRTGMAMPRVMIAHIPIPNAFAYGSPVAGTRVAVTEGMLRLLESEEVEAVVGHELGHLKHRDVQIMMFVSVLPAILYWFGYSLYLSSGRRDRGRASSAVALGSLSIFLYYILTLLSLRLSRLREYYADTHSVSIVEDGSRKLSEALAKIVTYTGRMGRFGMAARQFSNFKTLFISDPDTAEKDVMELRSLRRGVGDQELVQEILSREPSPFESFAEIFSTHPNIVKRLRALQQL